MKQNHKFSYIVYRQTDNAGTDFRMRNFVEFYNYEIQVEQYFGTHSSKSQRRAGIKTSIVFPGETWNADFFDEN